MTVKKSPEEIRYDAVQKLLGLCFSSSGAFDIHAVERTELLKRITELRFLGKSVKWTHALKWWAETVANEEIDLDYAMMQGAVRAVWAAQ